MEGSWGIAGSVVPEEERYQVDGADEEGKFGDGVESARVAEVEVRLGEMFVGWRRVVGVRVIWVGAEHEEYQVCSSCRSNTTEYRIMPERLSL